MTRNQFQTITKAVIDSWIAEGRLEDQKLDYKQHLPSSDRIKFVQHVCAMANAEGGLIAYGLIEERNTKGKTGKPDPVASHGLLLPNFADEVSRLENMLESGIERRILGVDFKEIAGYPSGSLILVWVPKSWNRPHMVTEGDKNDFMVRVGRSNRKMGLQQVESAFLEYDSLTEKIRDFYEDRLKTLVGRQLVFSPPYREQLVAHLIPFSAFKEKGRLDTSQIDDVLKTLPEIQNGFGYKRLALEGVLRFDAKLIHDNQPYKFLQFYRNGIVELVDGWVIGHKAGESLIEGPYVVQELKKAISIGAQYLHKAGFSPPLVIFTAIFGVQGFRLIEYGPYSSGRGTPLDRDLLRLPEVVLEHSLLPSDSDLKPIFDVLWNAGNLEARVSYP